MRSGYVTRKTMPLVSSSLNFLIVEAAKNSKSSDRVDGSLCQR